MGIAEPSSGLLRISRSPAARAATVTARTSLGVGSEYVVTDWLSTAWRELFAYSANVAVIAASPAIAPSRLIEKRAPAGHARTASTPSGSMSPSSA